MKSFQLCCTQACQRQLSHSQKYNIYAIKNQAVQNGPTIDLLQNFVVIRESLVYSHESFLCVRLRILGHRTTYITEDLCY